VSQDSYARPMRYLGWDPCPGDVGSVQHLAQQYRLCASEVRSIRQQVNAVDLSGWLGRTGEAIGKQRDGVAVALASCAQLAEHTGQVAADWARQLSAFQAEADALEQRAKTATQDQEFFQQRQAALNLGDMGPTRYVELDAAQALLLQVQQQASQLHDDYESAAARLASQLGTGSQGPWDRTEPVREILEGLLAPFDMAAGDQQLEFLAEIAETLEKWAGEDNEGIKEVQQLLSEGKSAVEELIEGGYTFDRMASSPALWSTVMRSLMEIKGAGYAMSGLGVLADIGTIISPQDKGALRDGDRTLAGVNGTLLTLNSTTDWVPYWGEALIIYTGAYLSGDYADDHCPLFREVTAEIAGASLSASPQDNIALAETAMHATHDAEHFADETGHVFRQGWDDFSSSVASSIITSPIGRWF
jgi:hypothetical protein